MQITSLKHLHIPLSFYFRSICPGYRKGQKIMPQHGVRNGYGSMGARPSLAVPWHLLQEPLVAYRYIAQEQNAKHSFSTLCKVQMARVKGTWHSQWWGNLSRHSHKGSIFHPLISLTLIFPCSARLGSIKTSSATLNIFLKFLCCIWRRMQATHM